MSQTTSTKAIDAVYQALIDSSSATPSQLAEQASMGRSTVSKALAALEKEGRVKRSLGNRKDTRRAPDMWSVMDQRSTFAVPITTGKLKLGELQTMVLDHLQNHPDDTFTPTALSKTLQRSSGAIGNALTRLVKDGSAIQIKGTPRRYSALVTS